MLMGDTAPKEARGRKVNARSKGRCKRQEGDGDGAVTLTEQIAGNSDGADKARPQVAWGNDGNDRPTVPPQAASGAARGDGGGAV